MLIDIVLAAVAFYFSIPLIAGYFAYSYGRSFWLWFIIGTFLPVITHLVLFAVVYLDEKATAKDKLNRRERVESERLVKDLIGSMSKRGEKEKILK